MNHHRFISRYGYHGLAPGGCAIIIMFLVAHATRARAQHWSVHGQGTVAGAWSDNVSNDPEGALTGPQTAFYTQLRPSLLFTYETPRAIHVSSAGIDITAYQTEDPPTTYSILLAHNSLFATGPMTELGLGAELATGRVSAVLGEPGGGVAPAAPQGDSTFMRGGLVQAYRWQIARNWRLVQTANLTQVNTDVEAAMGGISSRTLSRTAGASVGIERTWKRTAVGLTHGTSYIGTAQTRGDEDVMTRQIENRLALGGRRDLGPSWAASAEAGIETLTTFEAAMPGAEGTTVVPGGMLSINHFQSLGTVTGTLGLTLSHAIEPNLLLGTTATSTGAVLSGSLPLPWFFRQSTPTVRVSTTTGRVYSAVIDERLTDAPSWHVDTIDVALAWSPLDAWEVSLRYQLLASVVPDEERMLAEIYDISVPEDFTRNTILVQVGGRWPGRPAVTMPDRRPLRVDRESEEATEDEAGADSQAE